MCNIIVPCISLSTTYLWSIEHHRSNLHHQIFTGSVIMNIQTYFFFYMCVQEHNTLLKKEICWWYFCIVWRVPPSDTKTPVACTPTGVPCHHELAPRRVLNHGEWSQLSSLPALSCFFLSFFFFQWRPQLDTHWFSWGWGDTFVTCSFWRAHLTPAAGAEKGGGLWELLELMW